VKAHYCGGDLASLSLFKKVSCCCEDGPRKKKDDCCKNEIKTFKIADNQLKTEHEKFILDTDDAIVDLTVHHSVLFQTWSPQENVICTSLPKPPDRVCSMPAYKRNHSFLFYC
jgi:hypothetical protein